MFIVQFARVLHCQRSSHIRAVPRWINRELCPSQVFHGGSIPRENSFYRVPGGNWAQEICAECPQQRYVTGEPGKVQGRDRVGIL